MQNSLFFFFIPPLVLTRVLVENATLTMLRGTGRKSLPRPDLSSSVVLLGVLTSVCFLTSENPSGRSPVPRSNIAGVGFKALPIHYNAMFYLH